MIEIFWPEEVARPPEDAPCLGSERGKVGRIIDIHPNLPHTADVEFPRSGEKAAIARW